MEIKLQTIKLENIDHKELKPLQGNLKLLTEKNYARLKKSFEEKGMFVPVFVWRDRGTNYILDGHGRSRLFTREKAKFVDEHGKPTTKIPCIVIEAKNLQDAKQKLLIISSQYQSVSQEGFDEFAFDIEDDWIKDTVNFDKIFKEPAEDEEDSDPEDQIPAPPAKPVTRRGDIWLLGAHKVICGDSIDPETFKALFTEGDKARLAFTDPPYGVSYETEKFTSIANDSLTGEALSNFLASVFRNIVKYTDEKAAFYIWHGNKTREDFNCALKAAGISEKQYLIWVKPALTLGQSHYQWQHEPCFYASKDGETPAFYGNRTETTAWYAGLRKKEGMSYAVDKGLILSDGAGSEFYLTPRVPKSKKLRRVRIEQGKPVEIQTEFQNSDCWLVGRDTGKADHPTQKPVELARRALINSSKMGEIVLDPFLGSGTTLIGAEVTGRVCYGVELTEAYCDVIVARWEKLTGKKAERIKA